MNVEKKAAETLSDRGVYWKLPSFWFLRIIGKKTVRVIVKPIRLGTLLELSRIYAALDIKPEDLEKDPHGLILNNTRALCTIAAVCILNSKLKIRLFSGLLARFLLSRLTANNLLEIMMFIVTYSGVTAFTTTIRLIGEMRVTTPKILSPEIQGSQQATS
jgi:hypothetical protein